MSEKAPVPEAWDEADLAVTAGVLAVAGRADFCVGAETLTAGLLSTLALAFAGPELPEIAGVTVPKAVRTRGLSIHEIKMHSRSRGGMSEKASLLTVEDEVVEADVLGTALGLAFRGASSSEEPVVNKRAET